MKQTRQKTDKLFTYNCICEALTIDKNKILQFECFIVCSGVKTVIQLIELLTSEYFAAGFDERSLQELLRILLVSNDKLIIKYSVNN